MKKVISIILAIAILVAGGGILGYNHVQELIDESYNSGYDAGYDSGYDRGKAAGYKSGYDSGYDAGKSAGYKSGYDAGKVAAQSSYSSSSSYSSGSSSSSSYSTSGSGYYIGNANTGVFHYSYCSYLPEPQNRVAIYSRASAISQGYRPCGHCNP